PSRHPGAQEHGRHGGTDGTAGRARGAGRERGAGIASDYGLHLGWQLGLAVAGYALSIALLANISNTDPLKTLAAATGTLAALAYGLLRTAAAVLVFLGIVLAAVAGAFGHTVAT
ncbi:hypothetical protein, partial [Streptomyces sp. NPDC047968]|uniref:hypothetical protein n=1 Tax=Streptomyces sp. NPDC047968 TaxID=3155382 RepID=UPI003430C001